MGYTVGIDELSEEAIRKELKERRIAQIQGLCDYCHQPISSQGCRFPERHRTSFQINRLDFKELRISNVFRCEEVFHLIEDWTPAEWAVAMAGECGEVCNAVKKLRRLEDGTNTEKDPQTHLECINAIATELADLIIYADLLAARLGIDLGQAVVDKFNAVSILRKSTARLV